MSEINFEDLTPGTVVEPKSMTVVRIDSDGDVHLETSDGRSVWLNPQDIEAIISRPQTDADKIARLEAELAKRDARIAELTASKAEPTTPVWSEPIEGPPPKGLPAGSFQVSAGSDAWITMEGDSASLCLQFPRHRILMHQPIQWDGGERPVPRDWEMHVQRSNGTWYWATADRLNWSKPFTFTLTSTGGGND